MRIKSRMKRRMRRKRGGPSIWWQWMAPDDGAVTIDTEGSDFDTLLAIYTGSDLNGLEFVVADNNFGSGETSGVSFLAVAGQTYRIAVDGVDGAMGEVSVQWSLSPQVPAGYDKIIPALPPSALLILASGLLGIMLFKAPIR